MNQTKQLSHIYLELGENNYYDYSGIIEADEYYIRRNISDPEYPVFGYGIIDKFDEDNIDNYLDDTFSLSPGDKVHIVPDCKYNIADVRNNYKIARDFDAGVCNVYSPLNQNYRNRMWIDNVIVIPSLKKICFIDNYTPEAAKKRAMQLFPESDIIDMRCFERVGIVHSEKFIQYTPLLLGTAQKPCISYKKLQFNSNELNIDTLMIAYKVCNNCWADADAVDKAALQFAILNQHNWREYPRTLFFFRRLLSRNSAGIRVLDKASSSPKYIREIEEVSWKNEKFASEKDFNMAKDLVSKVLEINNDKMFVSDRDYLAKANVGSMNMYYFDELFNTIVRITPKQYDQK